MATLHSNEYAAFTCPLVASALLADRPTVSMGTHGFLAASERHADWPLRVVQRVRLPALLCHLLPHRSSLAVVAADGACTRGTVGKSQRPHLPGSVTGHNERRCTAAAVVNAASPRPADTRLVQGWRR